MDSILVIATRKTTLDSLSETLLAHNFTLLVASNARDAMREARHHFPDLIILDHTSARLLSHKLAAELRRIMEAPHIAIVRTAEEAASMSGTACLVRPYTSAQLLECISQALGQPRLLQAGPLCLDLHQRCIHVPHLEGPRSLPPKQFTLLRLLMQHQGEVLTRERLMRDVWDTHFLDDTRTLDVHVHWLREVIEPDPHAPRFLQTVRGQGYYLAPIGSDS